MTTGSFNHDYRVVGPAGHLEGRVHSKTWTGTDRSAPVQKDYAPTFYKLIHRGKLEEEEIFRIPLRRKDVQRPPKRSRNEEHPYSMSSGRYADFDVTYRYADGSPAPKKLISNFRGGWGAVSLLDANDQLKLLQKLREKLLGSDFNMSVFLGEGHQTLKMIGDTAIRIAKSLHHLRKGDLAGTARSLLEGTSRRPITPYKQMKPFKPSAERASSHWLELQYGWLPLLKDVEEGAHSLAHALSVPFAQTYRMSRRREVSNDAGNKLSYFNPIVAMQKRTHVRALKVIVTERPSVIAQLGLLNPELVAWELLPFSFVADWFIPIGSYLDARAITSAIVAKYVTTDYMTAFNYAPSSPMFTPAPDPSWSSTSVALTRTVSSSASLPLPRMKSLKQVASWQHCANAVALVTQLATGNKVGSRGF